LTAQTAQHWWQLAEQLLVQLSTCQLKLLELLGVDARVMLWFAQAIEHTTCKQQSFVVPASLQALAQLFACRLDSWQSQPSRTATA
jgi:ABC-type transporter Mla MlaB component